MHWANHLSSTSEYAACLGMKPESFVAISCWAYHYRFLSTKTFVVGGAWDFRFGHYPTLPTYVVLRYAVMWLIGRFARDFSCLRLY